MAKQKKEKKESKSKKTKIAIMSGLIVVVSVAGFFVWRAQTTTAFAQSAAEQPQTMALTIGDLTKTISISGAIESSNTKNVYSSLSYAVQEISVEVGDKVKKGDVIASLDTTNLMNEIKQAENNYANAVISMEEDLKNTQNSITNAGTSLESASVSLSKQQISYDSAVKDLKDAEEEVLDPFDPYTYENTIADAKLALERKTSDLEDAESDLQEALNDFDDYAYQNTIKDAGITLERKLTDLAGAEKDLKDEEDSSADSFDDYKYQNAITDAQTSYDRKQADFYTAESDYYNAVNNYNAAAAENQASAWQKVETAQKALESASRAIDDAYAALERSRDDLQKAKDDFYDTSDDTNTDTIEALTKNVDTAKSAVNDAQRAVDKANTDLSRAKADTAEDAADKVETARNAATDAERAYQKAVADMDRAKEEAIEDADKQLETAQKSVADGAKQLESAKLSVRTSQNSLDQAEAKTSNSGASADNYKLTLDKLNKQLIDSQIVAPADGVITQVNATVGAAASGVLFVIENTEVLYVTANVKEYNLTDISIGQKATITTDATGDTVYEGVVSYISPKAVSAAGSTSVEFEIQVDILQADASVKIGMNAFLEIITDSRENVYTLPLSAIVTNQNGSIVYSMEDGTKTEIAVTVGLETTTTAEISGDELHEGMMLLTNPTEVSAASQPEEQQQGGFMMGGQ